MTIINFPGGKKGRDDDVERASQLKRRLVEFVTKGPLSELHAREMRETGIHEPEFHEYVDFTDWFIFDWEGEDGATVLDEFLAANPDLPPADRELLGRWYDSIDDIFQVLAVTDDGVTLRDGEGETYVAIPTNMKPTELGWRPRTLVQTRLLPVADIYLLSGIQSFYSGPELDALPDDFNLAAVAEMIGEEEIDGGLEIDDVRDLGEDERPAGSVVAAGHEFLEDAARSLKPETVDAHALAVSLLAYYTDERAVERASDLDADLLRDFLAVWYARMTPDRTLGATRRFLGSVKKFATWLDRAHGTTVGRDFKARVLPSLEVDLPRTIKAAEEAQRAFPFFSVSQLISLASGEAAPREAGAPFHAWMDVVEVNEYLVTLREREGAGALRVVEFPVAAAALLRPGDVVEGEFLAVGDDLLLGSVACVYCPAAGV
jgi:hypothetical protein